MGGGQPRPPWSVGSSRCPSAWERGHTHRGSLLPPTWPWGSGPGAKSLLLPVDAQWDVQHHFGKQKLSPNGTGVPGEPPWLPPGTVGRSSPAEG